MTGDAERPEPHGLGPLNEDRTLAPTEFTCGVSCRVAGCLEPVAKRIGRSTNYCRTHYNALLGPIERRRVGMRLDVPLGRLRFWRPAAAWPGEWAWLRCDNPRCGYECVEKWLYEPLCHECVKRARFLA